jgi:hypothetical protein
MNKKTFKAAIAVCVLIFSVAGAQIVKLSEANFTFMPPDIAVNSPANGATCPCSDVSVSILVTTKGSFPYAPTFAACRLDRENSINITFVENNGLWFANGTFNNLSQAWHYLTADIHIMTFTQKESTYTVYSAFYVDLSIPVPTPTPTPTTVPSPTTTPTPTPAAPTPSPTYSTSPTPAGEPTTEPTTIPIPTLSPPIPEFPAHTILLSVVAMTVAVAALVLAKRKR